MDPQFASDRHFFDDLKAQVCEMVLTNLQMRSITSDPRGSRTHFPVKTDKGVLQVGSAEDAFPFLDTGENCDEEDS